MTLAAVDRLIHHATILELNVESYRRRTAVERRKGPGRPARQSTPPLIDAPRQSSCENPLLAAGAAAMLTTAATPSTLIQIVALRSS